MKLSHLFLAVFLSLPAFAQAQIISFTPITAAQCATIGVSPSTAVVAIQVTGTWTGTLQPKAGIQGQTSFNVQVTPSTSTTAQATITANGAYYALVAGYSTLLVCGNSVSSGTANVFLNGSQAPAGSGAGAPGSTAFSAVTPGTNTGTLRMGTTGSLAPSDPLAQIQSSQFWLAQGISAPSMSFALAGGSFLSGHAISVRVTYNTAAGGRSLPSTPLYTSFSSAGVSDGSLGCSSGSTCQLTITAPTLPTGYTSYSVYAQDCGALPCGGTETLQAGCTNITGNCVLNSVGAGAAIPTTNTAYLQPSPLAASECPAGSVPYGFVQDTTGTWHTQFAVDVVPSGAPSGPPDPQGTFTICRRTYINDSGIGAAPGKNGLFVVYHVPGVGVLNTNQDRALHVQMSNLAGDSGTYYGWEGIQSEVDILGSPVFNGAPDSEVSAGSFQTSDAHSGVSTGMNRFGPNAGRFSYTRPGTGSYSGCIVCGFGIYAEAINGNTATMAGNFIVGIYATAGTSVAATGVSGAGIYIQTPVNMTANLGLNITSAGAAGAAIGNRNMTSESSDGIQGINEFRGPVIHGTGSGGNAVEAFHALQTGAGANWAANVLVKFSGAPTTYLVTTTTDTADKVAGICLLICTGSGGTFPVIATSGVLQCVFDGATTANNLVVPSTTTAGNCHDSGFTLASAPFGFESIGTVLSTNGAGGTFSLWYQYQVSGVRSNCAAVGTAANPSVASCTAASFGSVSCATNASAGTCTVNTTIVTANSEIHITQRTDTTTGTRLSVTCNTGIDTVQRAVTAVTAATSFTFNLGTFTTNPECFSYTIVN